MPTMQMYCSSNEGTESIINERKKYMLHREWGDIRPLCTVYNLKRTRNLIGA